MIIDDLQKKKKTHKRKSNRRRKIIQEDKSIVNFLVTRLRYIGPTQSQMRLPIIQCIV